jgi:hypothetical protein
VAETIGMVAESPLVIRGPCSETTLTRRVLGRQSSPSNKESADSFLYPNCLMLMVAWSLGGS